MKSIKENESSGQNPDESITNLSESRLRKTILERIRNLPAWIVVSAIAMIFLILFCVIPTIIIDLSNQWCNLFSGFFNTITPGICL